MGYHLGLNGIHINTAREVVVAASHGTALDSSDIAISTLAVMQGSGFYEYGDYKYLSWMFTDQQYVLLYALQRDTLDKLDNRLYPICIYPNYCGRR